MYKGSVNLVRLGETNGRTSTTVNQLRFTTHQHYMDFSNYNTHT